MLYSVLSLTNSPSVSALLQRVLAKYADRFYSVGQFADALNALSFSVSLNPQIIVLDAESIKSFITWQQFVHNLTAKNPHTQFVVITDLSDDPADDRQAVLSASDLTEEQLIQALETSCQRIEQPSQVNSGRSFRHMDSSWFRSSQQFSELISNASFVHSNRFDRSLIRVKDEIGWLLIGEHRRMQNNKVSFFQDPGQLASLLQEIVHILNRTNGGNVFIASDCQLCLWFSSSTAHISDSILEIEKLCKQVNRALNSAGFPAFVFQCSNEPVSLELLGREYRNVSALQPYRFFVDDSIILYSDWLFANSIPMDFAQIDSLIVRIQAAIARLDLQLLRESFDQLLETTTHAFSVNSYHYIWCELVFLHNQQLQQHGALSEDMLPNFCYNDFSHIRDAFFALEGIFEGLIHFLSSKQSKFSNPYIQQVVEYITSHFTEDLTLSEAADFVHISVSYLSRLFKKEVGSSFTDFVNELRINRAKELLMNSDAKIYEIAQTVGFENTKYFSQVFKAYTGCSPKEFQTEHEAV